VRVKSGEGREKKKKERREKREEKRWKKMERFKISVLVKLEGGVENVRR